MTLCLVSGGAGFIGSHTVDLLLEHGYDVQVLDNLQARVHPYGKPSWLSKKVEFIHGDVSNYDDIKTALKDVSLVFHLAAYQDYMPDFSTFIHTNTESAALLFQIIVSDRNLYPVKKIVFASSQSVSGEGRYICPTCAGNTYIPTIKEQLLQPDSAYKLPISAVQIPQPRQVLQLSRGDWNIYCINCNAILKPLLINEETVKPGTPYAISKYAIELLADRLGKRYDIPTTCLRYTYVQGTQNSFYNAYSGIMRRFALRILHNLPPIVYEDGLQLRDYVNVRDVARANLLVLQDEKANFEVFNVGGEHAITVLEFARLILKEFNSDIEISIPREFRMGDTRHTISDTSKLQYLGWKPTISIEQSIREYISWIKNKDVKAEYNEQIEQIMKENLVIRNVNNT